MDYINVRPKAYEYSQLHLPHGTKQKRIMKKLKNGDAQKKRPSCEVRGVSPEAGNDGGMVGGLWWERFVKEVDGLIL